MSRARTLAACFALLTAGVMISPLKAIASGINGTPMPTADGYIYAFDSSTGTHIKIPFSDAGPQESGTSYEYTVTPACPGNNERGAIVCVTAGSHCASIGQAGLYEDVWRAETAPAVTAFEIVGHICSGGNKPLISEQTIRQDISEYERLHMPVPAPVVQPAAIAIVNIPVLVSLEPLGRQTMLVTQPTPGQLVATPTYTWTFDGDPATAVTGVGRPYDGVDPRDYPAHYVSHTYTEPEPHGSVTLTVTWNATFTTAGQTLTIPLLTMPPITRTFAVHEAHAVLVNN